MYVPKPVVLVALFVFLLLGVAVLLLLRGGGEEPGRLLDSYYFEARLAVEESNTSREPPGLNEERPDLIRAWYQEPGKWRREYTYSDPDKQYLHKLDISDGQQLWSYDGETNTYFVRELPQELRDLPGALRNYASSVTLAFSFVMGPLPAETIEEFFARYQLAGANWRVAGSETLLDTEAQVIEVEIGGGKTTFWVDPRYMFVLRYVAEGDGASIKAEVVDLTYDAEIGPDQFSFEPPEGARKVDAPGSGTSRSEATGRASIGGGGEIEVPDGFLTPAYIPQGYTAVRQGSSGSGGGMTTNVDIRLQPTAEQADDGRFLLIEEQFRAGGLPESLEVGTPVTIGDAEGFRLQEGDEARLVWSTGDIIITLRSNVLPFEELLRVAESMR